MTQLGCGISWHQRNLTAVSTLFLTTPGLNSSPTFALQSSLWALAQRPGYDSMESRFRGLYRMWLRQTGSGPLSICPTLQRLHCASSANDGSSTYWMEFGSFQLTHSGLCRMISLQWSQLREIFMMTCPLLILCFSKVTSTIGSWLVIEFGRLPPHSTLPCVVFAQHRSVVSVPLSAMWLLAYQKVRQSYCRHKKLTGWWRDPMLSFSLQMRPSELCMCLLIWLVEILLMWLV